MVTAVLYVNCQFLLILACGSGHHAHSKQFTVILYLSVSHDNLKVATNITISVFVPDILHTLYAKLKCGYIN